MWPDDATLLDAWATLVADHTTGGAFAELVLEPLTRALAAKHRTVDSDEVSSAAGDAVLAVLRRPEAYDPDRIPLARYLFLIAHRKLCDLFQRRRKHHENRIPWDRVELTLPDGNDLLDEAVLSFDEPALQAALREFTPEETAVFDLLRTGERRTAAFAALLPPTDDPAGDVKRVKDRILARLRRAVEGVEP